jgi:hypothetical protein
MQGPQSKQTEPLQDRIASFARGIREKASQLPPGKEKDDLLRRARLADSASHLTDWVSSPYLAAAKVRSRKRRLLSVYGFRPSVQIYLR